jgi:hypothetical protein
MWGRDPVLPPEFCTFFSGCSRSTVAPPILAGCSDMMRAFVPAAPGFIPLNDRNNVTEIPWFPQV